MFNWFKRKKPSNLDEFNEDPSGWSRDLQAYGGGEFSMASSQANINMEDYSQVDSGYRALFTGIYDGHRGIDAAQYISQHLFHNIISQLLVSNGEMSEAVLRVGVSNTEQGFINMVRDGYQEKNELAKVGSCCLAALIWKGRIYIANLGDSRAVLASSSRSSSPLGGRTLRTHQLTVDHNCNNEFVRNQVRRNHNDDPEIVVEVNGIYKIKGIIEVTGSIGDAWLKREDFTLNPDFPTYNQVPQPFTRSVLFKLPQTSSRLLTKDDRFIIFGSKGFWKLMSNDKAAKTVSRFPRMGIAKRLVMTAMEKAIKKTRIRSYRELRGYPKGAEGRLAFHDDITVIVVFLDEVFPINPLFSRVLPEMSYPGNSEIITPSRFAAASASVRLNDLL